MNFSQFLYSTIQVGIGVVIGWLLSLIAQLKMQKRQHDFELQKLEIERKKPYEESLFNFKFEAYSHIWAECMKCWTKFDNKQWIFKDNNTKSLLKARNNFSFEFGRKSITLEKSVVETIQYLIANFDSIIRNHASLCSDDKIPEYRKFMIEDTKKTKELLDKLVNEIRKDLNISEIEKNLAESFSPKGLPEKKSPKR